MQDLELRAGENFLGQLKLILEGRKQDVAFDDALHQRQVEVGTEGQGLLINLGPPQM